MLKSKLFYYLVTLTTVRGLEKEGGGNVKLGRPSAASVLKLQVCFLGFGFFFLHIEGGGLTASGDSDTKERLRVEEVTGKSLGSCFGSLEKLLIGTE